MFTEHFVCAHSNAFVRLRGKARNSIWPKKNGRFVWEKALLFHLIAREIKQWRSIKQVLMNELRRLIGRFVSEKRNEAFESFRLIKSFLKITLFRFKSNKNSIAFQSYVNLKNGLNVAVHQLIFLQDVDDVDLHI